MSTLRISRTLGISPTLSENDRYLLTQLTYAPGYTVLLDIFEQACIEQETRLLNANVSEPAEILAEHQMAKAFWQCFVYIQKRVAQESALGLDEKTEAERRENEPPADPDVTDILGF